MHVQVGTVEIDINYQWLRGTHDNGKRVRTLSLTVNRRKLKNLRSVVSHVSNVNHWMLSHDNVWAVLSEDHPALKRPSEFTAAGRSSLSHESKHHHSLSAGSRSKAGNSSLTYSADASQTAQAQVDLSGTSDGTQSSAPEAQPEKQASSDTANVRSFAFLHRPLKNMEWLACAREWL